MAVLGRQRFAAIVVSSVFVASALVFAIPATAQTAARDSGYVALETQLGGDSAQVTTASLRRGATYLVRVRPARAEVQLVRRVHDTTTVHPLAPSPAPESLASWRAFRVTTAEGGTHFVELTNPGIGATLVRVTLLRHAKGDTLATNERRTLVFSDNVTTGRSYVTLDSGVVYRIIAVGADVYIAPRVLYRTPLRAAPIVHPGPTGAAFLPEFTGEYRLSAGDGDASVRIYREEADAVQMACLTNPLGPGCVGTRRGRFRVGLLLAMISIPIAVLMLHRQ